MIGSSPIGASPVGADGTPTPLLPATGSAILAGPKQTLVATGTNVIRSASAALVAPRGILFSAPLSLGGTMNFTAPRGILSAFGGGFASLTAPRGVLSAAGRSSAVLTAPMPELLSTGRDSTGDNAASLSAPVGALRAFSGAVARLAAPAQVLTTSATVRGWGQAALEAPAATLSAQGRTSGVASGALSAPIAKLVGYSGAVCSVTLTGRAALTVTGKVGAVARAALSCPLFELTAAASAKTYGRANLLAPSPQMGVTAQAWLVVPGAQLTSIGSAVVTATYEAYAVNLRHQPERGVEPVDEMTRYTNFPFTHVVRYRNSYYGANSTGLYLLEGTTDGAAPIPWVVATATTDFGTPNLKTVASAYFGGRFGKASTITLSAGEKSPETYAFSTPRAALAQNHRQLFGRGVKARYYALSASGSAECELDDILLDVRKTPRRV